MLRNNVLAIALMLEGNHALAASPVFCPQGTQAESEITFTVTLAPGSTESRIYTATEFYGSPCYPFVILTEGGEDFPPTPEHPSEATQTNPVGTTVRHQTPWMEILGNPGRQARRTTDFERTISGGCTWASCASPNWDRTGNSVETRARSRPGSLGSNDGN
jgi:hypothetical protein